MTPLQAILKNILLLGMVLLLQKFHKGIDYGKYTRDMFFVILVLSLALPFILNPVSFEYSETYLNKPKEGYELKLEVLYENALLNQPPKSLSEGKHVISFMSLTCPHCRIAAKKLRIIQERNPDISFYFVLNGKDHELEEFFDDTRSQDIPHCKLKGKYFIELAGLKLPVIYLVNNSTVEHSVDYELMSEDAIVEWYGE
jgi:thiol-disulfide isomerase/thioredoxin